MTVPPLGMLAAFLVFLGVLFVMMASSQAKKDAAGYRIPTERVQMLSIVCFIGGVGLFAYILYTKAF